MGDFLERVVVACWRRRPALLPRRRRLRPPGQADGETRGRPTLEPSPRAGADNQRRGRGRGDGRGADRTGDRMKDAGPDELFEAMSRLAAGVERLTDATGKPQAADAVRSGVDARRARRGGKGPTGIEALVPGWEGMTDDQIRERLGKGRAVGNAVDAAASPDAEALKEPIKTLADAIEKLKDSVERGRSAGGGDSPGEGRWRKKSRLAGGRGRQADGRRDAGIRKGVRRQARPVPFPVAARPRRPRSRDWPRPHAVRRNAGRRRNPAGLVGGIAGRLVERGGRPGDRDVDRGGGRRPGRCRRNGRRRRRHGPPQVQGRRHGRGQGTGAGQPQIRRGVRLNGLRAGRKADAGHLPRRGKGREVVQHGPRARRRRTRATRTTPRTSTCFWATFKTHSTRSG